MAAPGPGRSRTPASPSRGPPPSAVTSSAGHSMATSRQRVNRAVSHPSPTSTEAMSWGRFGPQLRHGQAMTARPPPSPSTSPPTRVNISPAGSSVPVDSSTASARAEPSGSSSNVATR